MRFSAIVQLAAVAAAAAFITSTSASPAAEVSPHAVSTEVQPAAVDSSPVNFRQDMSCQGIDIWVITFEVCTAGTNYRKFSLLGKAVGATLAKVNCDLDATGTCQTKFFVPAGTTVLNWYCKDNYITVAGEYYPVWQTVEIREFSTWFSC
ncbi:hypothetical protein GQ42DRAFT_157647 [Ramicandelaber brevisporus]|nr:hypothetical protein GQ42DRAFT_157647 [Ramicandelaber brevisporus]